MTYNIELANVAQGFVGLLRYMNVTTCSCIREAYRWWILMLFKEQFTHVSWNFWKLKYDWSSFQTELVVFTEMWINSNSTRARSEIGDSLKEYVWKGGFHSKIKGRWKIEFSSDVYSRTRARYAAVNEADGRWAVFNLQAHFCWNIYK